MKCKQIITNIALLKHCHSIPPTFSKVRSGRINHTQLIKTHEKGGNAYYGAVFNRPLHSCALSFLALSGRGAENDLSLIKKTSTPFKWKSCSWAYEWDWVFYQNKFTATFASTQRQVHWLALWMADNLTQKKTFVGQDEKESQHGPVFNMLQSITQWNKHHHRLPSNPLRGIK